MKISILKLSIGLAGVVFGFLLIFFANFFPQITNSLLAYPTVGGILLGYGLGLITDEIGDARTRQRIQFLTAEDAIKRQCYSWILGCYLKFVFFVDRASWPHRFYYTDIVKKYLGRLNVADMQIYQEVTDFPTFDSEEFSKLEGLALESRAALSKEQGESLAKVAQEYAQPRIEATVQLTNHITTLLRSEQFALECFVVPILVSEVTLFPMLDFVDVQHELSALGLGNLAPAKLNSLTETLKAILKHLEETTRNPVIDKKFLAQVVDYVNTITPRTPMPGEGIGVLMQESHQRSSEAESLLLTVEKQLDELGSTI